MKKRHVSVVMVTFCMAVATLGVFAVQSVAGPTFRPCRIRGIFCLDVWNPVLCPDGNIYSNSCYAFVACQTNCVPAGDR